MKNEKRSIFAILFAFWVVLVILSNIPFIAETLIDYSDMDDEITSRLTFPQDGKQGHYYVERYNLTQPGRIKLVYTTDSNSLEVECTNIKVLKIYCREMYEKKSEDVFKRNPNLDSNYYKTYFIERDHFHVHVYTKQMIEKLEWIDTPVPYNVTVNGREWWLTEINYTYNNDGIVLTKVPAGHNYVDLYFKSNANNAPVAKIKVNKQVIGVGEPVTFNANESYDLDGEIISYVWDLGEGSYKIGVETNHTFSQEGIYNVILTVKDDDYLIDHAYLSIQVVKRVMQIIKTVDKPIATPGAILQYRLNSTINTSWEEGVKDIVITDVLADNLIYVDATPKPKVKGQKVTWTIRQAFESIEIPGITLIVKIDDSVENNTIILNNATLNYKGYLDQVFPSESSNIVTTTVRKDSILAPQIKSKVPDILLLEDSAPYKLDLSLYEFDFQDSDISLKWYITGENESLYLLSGEYSDNDELIITPVPNAFGDNLVKLWLVDSDGFSANQPLWINISPVNDAPVFLTVPDLIIHYDDPYSFNYEPYIYDIDNPLEELELFVSETIDDIKGISGTGSNLKSNSENINVYGFEVIYNYPKSYIEKSILISLKVFDGKISDEENIQINITDDYTPKLKKKMPNVYLKEGEIKTNVFDLDDYFSDPDEDSLFYSFGETHIKVVINDNNTVDMSSESSWFGVDTVTFRARDPVGAIAEDVILVFVEPMNDAPVIDGIPNLFVIHYDSDYMFDFTPYVYDEDNKTEDLFLILADSFIRTDPINDLLVIMNYPMTMVGMDVPVIITVSDGIDTDSETVTVRITSNWPPELAFEIPDVSFNEDEIFYNAFNLNNYFIDRDSETLFYSYGQKNVNISIDPDGSVDFSSAPNWYGLELVTFRASDLSKAFVESSIIVTVNPVNDAPEIEPLPMLEGVVKQLLKFDLTNYISDIDNNITELDISILSAKMDIMVSGNELVIYTQEAIQENITIIVNDGQYTVTANMIIKFKEEKGKGSPSLIEYLMSIIWLIIVLILVILSIFGYAGYRRYIGNYNIEEIFWIHNDGILIQSLSTKLKKDRKDKEIVSAMLTGIINFTQEAFSDIDNDSKDWSIKEIQMMKKNILIDKGKFTFMASIFSGRSGTKLYKQSNRVLKSIEKRYSVELTKWEGNTSKLVSARTIMKSLIPSNNEVESPAHKQIAH